MPPKQQQLWIATGNGERVLYDDLVDNPGRTYAVEHGNRGRLCPFTPCRRIPQCTFLHRKSQPQQSAPRPAAASLPVDVEEILTEMIGGQAIDLASQVAALQHGLNIRCCSFPLLKALSKFLDPNPTSLPPSVDRDSAVGSMILKTEKWFCDIDVEDNAALNNRSRELLVVILIHVLHRNVNPSMRTLENCRRLIAKVPIESGETQQLEQLCGERERALLHSHSQRRNPEHTAATRYSDDVVISPDLLHVLPTEDDFNDGRSKEAILRACPTLVVDVPIANHQRAAHVTAVFQVYREDYVAKVRQAVHVVRQTVPPGTKVRQGRLPHEVHQRLQEADPNREVFLYLNLTCTGVSVHRNSGVVYTFQLDPQQFQGRKLNWDKRLMHGNLILLSSAFFDSSAPMWYGTIQRQRLPPDSTRARNSEGNDRGRGKDNAAYAALTTFDVCLENHETLLGSLSEAPSFSALESSAFFVPYQRVLTALLEILRSPTPTLPLEAGLLAGDTAHVPLYLLNHPTLKIGKAVQLRHPHAANPQQPEAAQIDVRDRAQWAARCEPWTAQREMEMKENHQCHFLDPTQLDAAHHIFTHNVAVVQGTPGTGKTFMGAKFAQILLDNFAELQVGPILCICETNHAVDAFLSDLLCFESEQNVVRVGGSTKDPRIAQLALTKKLRFMGNREHEVATANFHQLSKEARRINQLNPVAISADDEATLNEVARHLPRALNELLRRLFTANEQKRSTLASLKVELQRECQTYNRICETLQQLYGVRANTFADAKRVLDNRINQTEKLTTEHQRLQVQLDSLLQQAQVDGVPNATATDVLDSLSSILTEMRTNLRSAQEEVKRLASLAQKRQQKQQSKKKASGKGKQKKSQQSNKAEKGADDADAAEKEAAAQLKETVSDLEKSIAETETRRKTIQGLVSSLSKVGKNLEKVALTASQVTDAQQLLGTLKAKEDDINRITHEIAECEKLLSLPVLQQWLRDAPPTPGGTVGNTVVPRVPDVRREEHRRDAGAGGAQLPADDDACGDTWYQRDVAMERRFVAVDDSSSADEEESEDEFSAQELAIQKQQEKVHENEKTLEHLCSIDVEQATRANRAKILELALFFWSRYINEQILDLIKMVEGSKSAETARRNRDKAQVMRGHRIIGATTAGCALELEAMKMLAPKVIIVEEAAEVLESHVLACLTQRAQHLVLIGDHKQLRPKVEEYLLGEQKHLDVSLMERLVRIGAPYVTLTTQRRMHHEISDFTKLYYRTVVGKGDAAVTIVDHPATDLRVPIRGVRDSAARVCFVSHSGNEQHAEKKHDWMDSWCNRYEANLALAIAQHLLMCNVKASITVLCPYSGQVMTTLELAKRFGVKYHSKASPGGVKIVSVDDYQGEESDIIILSLTRTTEEGFQRGFLKEQNRACVALSRARCGMYLIGCLEALRSSANPVWQECIRLVEARGVVSDAFPAECVVHPGENMTFDSIEQQQSSRCSKLCGMPLPNCGHLCQGLCHFGDDRHAKCHAPCERTPEGCPYGHKCGKRCCERCGPCQAEVTVVCNNCRTSHQVVCNKESKFKCDVPLTRPGLCNESHQVTAPCFMWTAGTARSRCLNPCGEKMPCTHVCERLCHVDDEQHAAGMSKCQKPKTVKHPSCKQHPITVLCSLPTAEYPKCNAACEGLAPCGHPCTSQCHANDHSAADQEPHRCTGRTSDRHCPLCNKVNPFPCDVTATCCPTPCDFTLPCGHTCQGTCGTCKQSTLWYDHQPCTSKCKKVNVCGHECRGGCTEECPPCSAPCDFSCGHGDGCANAKAVNRHICGECSQWECQSDCGWACPHYRCQKRCFEPCDRPVCDAPCKRCNTSRRPCGHSDPCLGLCGEASCPEFCPSCFRIAKEEKKAPYPPRERIVTFSIFLMENEVDDFLLGKLDLSNDEEIQRNPAALRLVEMRCCGKTMLAGDLDRHIVSKSGPTEEIRLVPCPLCREPLRSDHYRRQGSLIKKRQEQVRAVRAIVQERHEQVENAAAEQSNAVLQSLLWMLGDDETKERFEDLAVQYEELPRLPRPLEPQPQRKKAAAARERFEKSMKEWEGANEALGSVRTKMEAIITERERTLRGERTHSARLRSLALSIALPLWLYVTDSSHQLPVNIISTLQHCVQYCDMVDRLRTPSEVLNDALRIATDVLASIGKAMHTGSFFGTGERGHDGGALPMEYQGMLLQAAMLWTRIENVGVAERERREMLMSSKGLSPSWIAETHAFTQYEATFEKLLREAKRVVDNLPFFSRGHGRVRFFENCCLRSSCPSFQRFMNGLKSRGDHETFSIAMVNIGFHGTDAEALKPICCRGFDVTRRRGQAHGPGEYFAKDPQMSDEYARGTQKMLICAIAKEPPTTEHQFGWVVNNPIANPDAAFAIPLGVVAYGAVHVDDKSPLGCTCPISVDHSAVQRLRDALLHDFPVHRGLPISLSSATKSTKDLGQVLDVTERAVEALEDRCHFQKPPREYLLHLTKVLGVTAGHWYQCSQGHLYVIADCGGAMVESRCPECGEVIGGQQHRLVSGSTSAASLVVEGAQAAWPS